MSKVILPPATIGIIGGGQLGRMIAIAAKQMGYHIAGLEPLENGPLAQVADIEINAPYEDQDALTNLLAVSDVITYEFENIKSDVIKEYSKKAYLPQGHRPLEITQHRYREKREIEAAGFKVAPYALVTNEDTLLKAVEVIGFPCILKTVSGGYDGKGQWLLRDEASLNEVIDVLSTHECILEGFVSFEKELSVIVTRGTNGQVETFPVSENIHVHHILHQSIVPARVGHDVLKKAEQIARELIVSLDFVGTLAIEMFLVKDELVINELAPRPHNSGHYTIEGCNISQFEQHVRAVTGLPLIKPTLLGNCVMINILGQHVPYVMQQLQTDTLKHAKVHLYGKKENREMRKVGHLTFVHEDYTILKQDVDCFLKNFGE